MVALPQISDPTLDAVDRAMEARAQAEHRDRPYLGASAIGKPCERALWYDFRKASHRVIPASGLKRIEDGHAGEQVQADRLRLVAGIELYTEDPETGGQIGIDDHGGHFRGHLDGVIGGLLQAPKTWHVWEHKQVGDDKLRKLVKLKATLGEKSALAEWDPVYFAQAQIYMHYMGFTRHYLTVASPGGRETVSCRTEYDAEAALRLIVKARRIIFTAEPLPRISEKPEWFECKFCDHCPICHRPAKPRRTCGTCIWATPHPHGGWGCGKHARGIDPEQWAAGCPEHRYIPPILNAEQIDGAADGSWISYRIGETEWTDEGPEHD